MRKWARATILVITSLIAAGTLWITSALAALAFGAIALIVPGTGTHNIGTVTEYKENAADRYINPSGVDCTSEDGCQLLGVDYPASFWPVPLPGWCPGLTCDTWDESVGEGVTNLNAHLADTLDDPVTPENEQIIVFGYSQGGAVVSRAMYDIPAEDRDRVTVVTIGNINNPQGLWSRLSFLRYVPILNVSFGPQLPTDIGVKSTNYSFEYDPVGDAPQYWGNPLAVLNALMAFEYVHGYYLDPNSNGPTDSMPYGYDDASLAAAIAAAPKRTQGDATFVLIPQRGTLPLFMPLIATGNATGTSAIIEPVVRLLQPVTKLLIDLGYDRQASPGIARKLSILPFNPYTVNPIQFSMDLVEALIQGVEDAFRGGNVIGLQIPTPSEIRTDELAASDRLATADQETAFTAVVHQDSEESVGGIPEGDVAATPVVADVADEQERAEDRKDEDSKEEEYPEGRNEDLVEDEGSRDADSTGEEKLDQEDAGADTPAGLPEDEEARNTDDGQDVESTTDTAQKAAA